jgi:hypothetical protein
LPGSLLLLALSWSSTKHQRKFWLLGCEGDVASVEGLRKSISVDGEGFGLAELFVEAPIVPEVDDSTKLCDFLANLASKKKASKSPFQAPLEIPVAAAASFCVPSTVAMEGTQVVLEDPIADKRNAFLSLVFRPLPPPILATPSLGAPVLL